jgi:hypothetical protein
MRGLWFGWNVAGTFCADEDECDIYDGRARN